MRLLGTGGGINLFTEVLCHNGWPRASFQLAHTGLICGCRDSVTRQKNRETRQLAAESVKQQSIDSVDKEMRVSLALLRTVHSFHLDKCVFFPETNIIYLFFLQQAVNPDCAALVFCSVCGWLPLPGAVHLKWTPEEGQESLHSLFLCEALKRFATELIQRQPDTEEQ